MLAAPMLPPPAPARMALVRPFPELHVDAKRLEPAVRSLIGYLLREPWQSPEVDDACHEVFRRALESRERWIESEPLRPWLLGIARHVALDVLRTRRRAAARALPARGAERNDSETLLETLADPKPGPDHHLQLAEQRARVAAAMAVLPADHRQALWLFHAEGLDYRSIAARLGVPIGTVCTWILRARRRLAAELGSDETHGPVSAAGRAAGPAGPSGGEAKENHDPAPGAPASHEGQDS